MTTWAPVLHYFCYLSTQGYSLVKSEPFNSIICFSFDNFVFLSPLQSYFLHFWDSFEVLKSRNDVRIAWPWKIYMALSFMYGPFKKRARFWYFFQILLLNYWFEDWIYILSGKNDLGSYPKIAVGTEGSNKMNIQRTRGRGSFQKRTKQARKGVSKKKQETEWTYLFNGPYWVLNHVLLTLSRW